MSRIEVGDLVRVVAPHFVAGLIMQGGRCVEAAPILHWAMGRDVDWLRGYFRRAGWRATIVTARPSRLERAIPSAKED